MLCIQHRDNLLIHDLTMTLGECSHNGIIANQQHEVLLATQISDFCSALLEFGNALVSGIGDGLTHAAHGGFYSAQATLVCAADACRDPQQAVCDTGHYVFDNVRAIYAVSKDIIERISSSYIGLLREVYDIVAVCIDDPELGYRLLSTCSEYIHDDIAAGVATIQTTADYIITTAPQWCTPDNARTAAAFATEHGVKLAVHHCLAKTYTTIAGHAMTYAIKAARVAGSQVLQEGRECFDLASNIAQRMHTCISDSPLIASTTKKITHYIERGHELGELLPKYMDTIPRVTCVSNIINKPHLQITENFLKHIFGIESLVIGSMEKLSGLHHDYLEQLETKGIVQLFNKIVCPITGVMAKSRMKCNS